MLVIPLLAHRARGTEQPIHLLVVLAVVSGTALVLTVLSLLVAQQRDQFTALKAARVSGRLLPVATLTQGLVVGALGGTLGMLVSRPATQGINRIVGDLTGVPNLIELPLWLFATGVALAIVMGVLGSPIAGWRGSRSSPLAHLQR